MNIILQNYFRFVKKFLPARKQGTVVGLDINPSVCHAVEVSWDGEEYRLLGMFSSEVSDGDERGALSRLQNAFGKSTEAREFVAALSGRGTLARYVEMPRMSQSDLKKAFLIESDRYFPFPKENIYSDCHILDPQDKDKKMSVLVAAAKRDLADARLKLLKDAGIECCGLTLNSVALANAFRAFPPALSVQDSGAAAVIDIGEAGSNLMIFDGGKPLFSRDIFIGLGEMVRKAAAMTAKSPAELRSVLLSGREVDAQQRQAVDIVTGSLISELRLSFDYFITEKNRPISQIYAIGEGVSVPGLEGAFAQAFDIPVAVWDPLAGMKKGSGIDASLLARDSRRMVAALGMAVGVYDHD